VSAVTLEVDPGSGCGTQSRVTHQRITREQARCPGSPIRRYCYRVKPGALRSRADKRAATALAASLVRGEFLPERRKPILCALALSLVVFGLLLFGNSMTSQFDSVASHFTYFGVTVVLMVFVLLLPPYRPLRWLSSLPPD
jgi:hypothetical protein